MPQITAAKAALDAQLGELQKRLSVLKETFLDERLKHDCEAELADLRHVGKLVEGVHAAGSLRVLGVMIETNARRVVRLEEILETYGVGAKLVG